MKASDSQTAAWGVDDGYEDADGERRETSQATRQAIITAMGGVPGATPPAAGGVRVITAGETAAVGRTELVLENGTVLRVDERLPRDMPLGYHELRAAGGERTRLIVAPSRCPLPSRAWGWTVQLYAARSAASWGFGDLADLRWLAEWSRSMGAGFMLVNPVHAATPVVPHEPSPYFPSSRRFRSPLYLAIEAIPGADMLRGLDDLVARGRALNSDRRLDRDAVLRLKLEALERIWMAATPSPPFEAFRAEHGAALEAFATFCVLAGRHGPRWRAWPSEYRDPRSPAVARAAGDTAGRVAFHAWVQWLLDEQLARAAAILPIVQDLPIGVDPDGADAWVWQEIIAAGAAVGAPPDRYNRAGQNWGLAPLIPHRLRAAGYEPFIQTLLASLRHAGGLRIDHVMGLFRLYWIPVSSSAADGGYVRYPADDLLAIVALESQRAGAFVVGEDLGTVEAGVPDRLAEKGVLSYRVLWFEDGPTSHLPERALATVTTHDLPTIRGLWTGDDIRAQRAAGLEPNEDGLAAIRRRIAQSTGLGDNAPTEVVIEAVYQMLGEAPSLLVAATLEDAFAVAERPNMPGAPPSWPNWSLGLPGPIESLQTSRLASAIAAAISSRNA